MAVETYGNTFSKAQLLQIVCKPTQPGNNLTLSLKSILRQHNIKAEIKLHYTRCSINRSLPLIQPGGGQVDLRNVLSFSAYDTPQLALALKQARATKDFEYLEIILPVAPLFVPSDPFASASTGNQATILNLMKVYQAWDITKGDSTVVIGILDTGTKIDHEDLVQNIFINIADPINGIDDDNNGFVDDYYGWDFGDNDNGVQPTNDGHGTRVAGIAGARTNNGKGIAGLAYNCKILPVKVFGAKSAGYDGILYAANRGCKVINLSWGRYTGAPSQWEQDCINYATFNKNATVVAAAGNSGGYADFFPSSYNNVLSVTYTDAQDNINPTATRSYNVDLSAPGTSVFGLTDAANGYANIGDGSSWAAPMASAAVALVRSKFPLLNALQAAELVKANADVIDNNAQNVSVKGTIGVGRLNFFKAASQTNPVAIRLIKYQITNQFGYPNVALLDTGNLQLSFQNVLSVAPATSVMVSPVTVGVQMLNSSFNLPALSVNATVDAPTIIKFRLVGQPTNVEIVFKIITTGVNYTYTEYIKTQLNTNYLTLSSNRITSSLCGNGRLGFNDVQQFNGMGFSLDGTQLLGEGGLMVTSNAVIKTPNTVFDTIGKDQDFSIINVPKFITYNATECQATSTLSDSGAGLRKIGLSIKQNFKIYNFPPADRCLVAEYTVTNTTLSTIDSVSLGLYTDFDLGNYNTNRADLDTLTKTGYTYSLDQKHYYTGIQPITTGRNNYFAIDAINAIANNNINLFDGFSLSEKRRALTSGYLRTQAGYLNTSGNNVVSVTGTTFKNLLPNTSRKVIYLLSADTSKDGMLQAMAAAKAIISTNQSAIPPVGQNYSVCRGSDLTIAPAPGNSFKFYSDASMSILLYEGRFYNLSNNQNNNSIYVTSTDSLFESTASAFTISIKNAMPVFNLNPNVMVLSQQNILQLSDNSEYVATRQWFINNVKVDTAKNFSKQFISAGIYAIKLVINTKNGCKDSTLKNYTVLDSPLGITNILNSKTALIYPNPASNNLIISLPNTLANADMAIFDALGKTYIPVITGTITEGVKNLERQIDVSSLPSGSYYLKFIGKNEAPKAIKFNILK